MANIQIFQDVFESQEGLKTPLKPLKNKLLADARVALTPARNGNVLAGGTPGGKRSRLDMKGSAVKGQSNLLTPFAGSRSKASKIQEPEVASNTEVAQEDPDAKYDDIPIDPMTRTNHDDDLYVPDAVVIEVPEMDASVHDLEKTCHSIDDFNLTGTTLEDPQLPTNLENIDCLTANQICQIIDQMDEKDLPPIESFGRYQELNKSFDDFPELEYLPLPDDSGMDFFDDMVDLKLERESVGSFELVC